MEDQTELRPLERAVLRLHSDGASSVEIGRRFRRSPAHIERVIRYATLPGRRGIDRPGLRPIERRVLAWRAEGLDHQKLALKFKRSAEHMRRIEGLAHLRKARELLA